MLKKDKLENNKNSKKEKENKKTTKKEEVEKETNKSIKPKKTDKNNSKKVEIVNIDNNSSKDVIHLIKEIASMKRKIAEELNTLTDCKNCSEKINKECDLINDEIQKLIKKYNLEKQFADSRAANVNYPSLEIDKLEQLKINLKNFNSNISCKKHVKLLKKINLDRIEVNSLELSLDRLNKKR